MAEAIGLAAGVIGFMDMAIKTTSLLHERIGSFKKDTDGRLFHTRCYAEMAKMETSMQVLSSYNDTQEGRAAVKDLLERATKASMEMAQYLQSVQERSRWRPTERSWEKLNNLLLEIVSINDELFMHVSELRETESRSSSGRVSNHYLDSSSLEALNDASSSPPQFTTHYGRGQVLQRIIVSVSTLLEHVAQQRAAFGAVFNEFQLWRHHVESEGLFEALNLAPADKKKGLSPGQAPLDLGFWLMKVIGHLGHNLAWYQYTSGTQGASTAARDFHSSLKAAVDTLQLDSAAASKLVASPRRPSSRRLEPANTAAGNQPEGEKDDDESVTLRRSNLTLRALRNTLPTVIDFCRQWRTQSDDVEASDVVALLDISVDLIAPAAEVLSKAEVRATSSQAEPKPRIDMDSINRVFDEQASVLRKWKDKNRHTIETKLVSQSPAKLASAANAVGNIAKLLNELPANVLAQKDGKEADCETLESMMKTFETSVQALVALEGQLDIIEAPPAYGEISRDRPLQTSQT